MSSIMRREKAPIRTLMLDLPLRRSPDYSTFAHKDTAILQCSVLNHSVMLRCLALQSTDRAATAFNFPRADHVTPSNSPVQPCRRLALKSYSQLQLPYRSFADCKYPASAKYYGCSFCAVLLVPIYSHRSYVRPAGPLRCVE